MKYLIIVNIIYWKSVFQLPELSQFAVGLMHIQLLHTSASLAINENWDPDVRWIDREDNEGDLGC